MSFSSGVFSINSTGQPVVTGTVISSTDFNALTADLATGLSTCVLKDGTQTITANIPMSNFKLTGLSAGTASGNSLRYEQVNGVVTTAGDILYATGAGALSRLAIGTARQQLATNAGATAPEWVASLQSLMTTTGDVVYASSANTPARLAIGTAYQHLRVNSGATAPEYAGGYPVQTVKTQTGAVATGTTVMPSDDSIPQNTEGDEYMTLAITPKSATSTLYITVHALLSSNTSASAAGICSGALFQDSTADALAASSVYADNAGSSVIVSFTHTMTSGTTSARTFKFRAGPGAAATMTFNGVSGGRLFGGVAASSIVITEVLP